VGLPDDPDLKPLGIKRHSLESHLLRFLFDHPERCLHERTERRINEPKQLLSEILRIARQHDPPLDSAKDVFLLLSGILGRTGSIERWIEKLLRNVQVEHEPAFKELCQHLKQALSL
jgi:hypothetical protein